MSNTKAIQVNNHLLLSTRQVGMEFPEFKLSAALIYLEIHIRKSGFKPEDFEPDALYALLKQAAKFQLNFHPRLGNIICVGVTGNRTGKPILVSLLRADGLNRVLGRLKPAMQVEVQYVAAGEALSCSGGAMEVAAGEVSSDHEAFGIKANVEFSGGQANAFIAPQEWQGLATQLPEGVAPEALAETMAVNRAMKTAPMNSRELMDLVIWLNSGILSLIKE